MTTYPIPAKTEKDQGVVNCKLIDCVYALAKRNGDLEQRIQALEAELRRGFIRRLREWFIGRKWKIEEVGTDAEELHAKRLENGEWVSKGWFS